MAPTALYIVYSFRDDIIADVSGTGYHFGKHLSCNINTTNDQNHLEGDISGLSDFRGLKNLF